VSIRGIRDEMKTRTLYLMLTKTGPYRPNGSLKAKTVSVEEIQKEIIHDENIIKRIREQVDLERIEKLQQIREKYKKLQKDEEWKELYEAGIRLINYDKLIDLINKSNEKYTSLYPEVVAVLEDNIASKYRTIMENSKYKEFYKEYLDSFDEYKEEIFALKEIEIVETSIKKLKEYCVQHPNEIKKGCKKSR